MIGARATAAVSESKASVSSSRSPTTAFYLPLIELVDHLRQLGERHQVGIVDVVHPFVALLALLDRIHPPLAAGVAQPFERGQVEWFLAATFGVGLGRGQLAC